MKKILKNKLFVSFSVAIFWLAFWEVAALAVGRSVLLPSPVTTAQTLFSMVKESSFWISCLNTLLRIATGFAAGAAAGTVIGFICFKWSLPRQLLSPLQNVIKATPVASFIILALVWLGKNTIPSFTAFLMATPIMWSGVYSSLMSIDKKLTEAAVIFPLTLSEKIKYIYVPSMKTKYISALETSLGLAWKAGIAAEVLCMPANSMGKELHDAKVYIETEKLFAWTFCIIVISMILEYIMKKIFAHILSEGGEGDGHTS